MNQNNKSVNRRNSPEFKETKLEAYKDAVEEYRLKLEEISLTGFDREEIEKLYNYKIPCPCGEDFTKTNLSKHLRHKKHVSFKEETGINIELPKIDIKDAYVSRLRQTYEKIDIDDALNKNDENVTLI